jgi:hypothetical protein
MLMLRKAGFVLLAVFLAGPTVSGPTVSGQEWARKMFEQTSHDFGSVARDGKAEFEFVLSNIYMKDVHIASVRSSCGCTSPRIKKAWLTTYEKGAIIAAFNTRSFVGRKGATVTVVFDKPLRAEVQLHVSGYIRDDVVLDPGSVQFDTVDQGTPADAKITVDYAGRPSWKILEVKSGNPNLSGKVVETSRRGGRVSYDLLVHLDENAPAAYLQDHLTLITNDPRSRQIPVRVEGRVQAAIMVSPAALFMGVLRPGKEVTRQLVVQGKRPFRILSITCDDDFLRLQTLADDAARLLHVIPVTFVAGERTGKVAKTIWIETDLGETKTALPTHAVVLLQ